MTKKRCTKTRECLCCGKGFESEGPQHRQCVKCRYQGERWGGGLENLGLEQRHHMGEVRRG